MANTITLKRSAVQSKVPLTTDLALGELAINTYDGDIYLKRNDGSDAIVKISNDNHTPKQNLLINGNFFFWQRSISSQTTVGYTNTDRWRHGFTGAGVSITAEMVYFTVGQTDVPNNPLRHLKTTVTSADVVGHYVTTTQRIEDVRILSGDQVALSFYAKSTSSAPIAVEISQNFGTGGSPSTAITAVDPQKVTLTTSWARYDLLFDVPSITGKTIGTDENSYTEINFWYTAGSDFDTRTDTLGQQSPGAVFMSQVKMEKGSISTDWIDEDFGIQLTRCQRFYCKSYDMLVNPGTSTTSGALSTFANDAGTAGLQARWPVTMRAAPAVSSYSTGGTIDKVYITSSDYDASVSKIGETGATIENSSAGTGNAEGRCHYIADAEL